MAMQRIACAISIQLTGLAFGRMRRAHEERVERSSLMAGTGRGGYIRREQLQHEHRLVYDRSGRSVCRILMSHSESEAEERKESRLVSSSTSINA